MVVAADRPIVGVGPVVSGYQTRPPGWQPILAFAIYEMSEAHYAGSDENGVPRCCDCYQPWPCDPARWTWDAAETLLDGIEGQSVVWFDGGRSITASELCDIVRQRERYTG